MLNTTKKTLLTTILSISLGFFSCFFILVPSHVYAEPEVDEDTGFVGCSGTNCDACKFLNMVKRILNWGTGIAFLVATGLIIYGGLVMMVTGAAKGIENGQNIIKWALIGLVVILLSWLIISIVIVNLVAQEARGDWFTIDCDKFNNVLVPANNVDMDN